MFSFYRKKEEPEVVVMDYTSQIRILMSEIIILKLRFPDIMTVTKDADKSKSDSRIKTTRDMRNNNKLRKQLGD